MISCEKINEGNVLFSQNKTKLRTTRRVIHACLFFKIYVETFDYSSGSYLYPSAIAKKSFHQVFLEYEKFL